jgi:hypothetical protein
MTKWFSYDILKIRYAGVGAMGWLHRRLRLRQRILPRPRNTDCNPLGKSIFDFLKLTTKKMFVKSCDILLSHSF